MARRAAWTFDPRLLRLRPLGIDAAGRALASSTTAPKTNQERSRALQLPGWRLATVRCTGRATPAYAWHCGSRAVRERDERTSSNPGVCSRRRVTPARACEAVVRGRSRRVVEGRGRTRGARPPSR